MGSERGILGTQFYLFNFYLSKLVIFHRFDTCHPKSPVLHLEGDYRNDELTGRARMQMKDETWQEGWYKESVLHGFCRKFDKNHQLSWVGMFRNGQPVGNFNTCFTSSVNIL